MTRKRIAIALMVMGMLLSVSAGAVVYMQARQAMDVAARIPVVDVVVARVELPERVAVRAEGLAIARFPADVVPRWAASRIEEVMGKYPTVRIYEGEMVLLSRLVEASVKTTPAFALKPGMVAVSIPGADLLTGTGAIQPGDLVDIVLTVSAPNTGGGQAGSAIPFTTQKLLQNVQVLRVGAFPSAGQPDTGGAGKGTVTVQVDHQDALALIWAKDSGSTINLVLRHPDDREAVPTEAINSDYVFRRFRFAAREPLP